MKFSQLVKIGILTKRFIMFYKLSPIILASLLMACQTPSPTTAIGGQTDQHGCLPSTGATWSHLKQACVQTFNVADIRLSETIDGTTYGVDVILSDDRSQAEVFAVSLPDNTILTAVKGGYVSDDGKIRLMKTTRGWRLIR